VDASFEFTTLSSTAENFSLSHSRSFCQLLTHFVKLLLWIKLYDDWLRNDQLNQKVKFLFKKIYFLKQLHFPIVTFDAPEHFAKQAFW
jgi:hypothetical protein